MSQVVTSGPERAVRAFQQCSLLDPPHCHTHLLAALWSRAAAAATMGVDMEVPSMGPYQPLTRVDTIASPGAVRCTVVLQQADMGAARSVGACMTASRAHGQG